MWMGGYLMTQTSPITRRAEIQLIGFQEEFCKYQGVSLDGRGQPTHQRLISLVRGGIFSAKSYGGALKMVFYIRRWPGAPGIVLAPSYPMMERATLPTIRAVLTSAGLDEGEFWTYNDKRREFEFWNGAVAWLASSEDPERLRGPTVAWWWIDEVLGDSPEQQGLPLLQRKSTAAFINLMGRLRKPGYPLQGWITTSPSGRRHYLHAFFVPKEYERLTGESIELSSGDEFRSYEAWTKDNPFGGQQMHETMMAIYGGEDNEIAQEQLYGRFVLRQGLVLGNFRPNWHIRPLPDEKPDLIVAGVDFGYDPHPFAILVEGYDKERKRRTIREEFSGKFLSHEQMGRKAKELMARHGIAWFFCDSADPQAIAYLRSVGIPALRANKLKGDITDVNTGLGACKAALTSQIDLDGVAEPGLIIDPSCRRFVQQLEDYTTEDVRPKNHDFDLIDSWRYAEMGLLRVTRASSYRKIPLRIE